MIKFQFKKLDSNAKIPTRANKLDVGYDLYSLENVFIQTGSTVKIKTGIALNVPEGFIAEIKDRSGMALLGLRTGGGVIDPGYNGSVDIVMHNISNSTFTNNDIHVDKLELGYQIKAGAKIAQVVLYKVETPELEEVTELWLSERGVKSFGASGW